MEKEIWTPVPSWEARYEVSTHGNVRRIDTQRPLKLQLDVKGYHRVSLAKKPRFRQYFAHRLVAMTFIPNPENKTQVNHKDGIKTNNLLSNLEWATPLENMRHALATNLRRTDGAYHPSAKLTEKDVREIRSLAPFTKTTVLAKKYGVLYSTIWCIIRRKLWTRLEN